MERQPLFLVILSAMPLLGDACIEECEVGDVAFEVTEVEGPLADEDTPRAMEFEIEFLSDIDVEGRVFLRDFGTTLDISGSRDGTDARSLDFLEVTLPEYYGPCRSSVGVFEIAWDRRAVEGTLGAACTNIDEWDIGSVTYEEIGLLGQVTCGSFW